jgi:UDP-2,3-diacylglucosamine hydrolase
MLQRLFRSFHPRWGLAWAHRWSRHNRLSKELAKPFGEEQEKIVQLLRRHNAAKPVHHYILGHRHTPVRYPLGNGAMLTILGEWITGGEYAVFDGISVELLNG